MPSSYSGRVVPGRGLGRPFMSRPDVAGTIEAFLGGPAVPGTLNLRLERPFVCEGCARIDLAWFGMTPAEFGLEVDTLEYDVGRVLIEDRIPGLLLQGKASGYPRDMVELICGVRLRDELGLSDGDSVRFQMVQADPVR